MRGLQFWTNYVKLVTHLFKNLVQEVLGKGQFKRKFNYASLKTKLFYKRMII